MPNGTAIGNMIEMQLNQGKLDSAWANVIRLEAISPIYGNARDLTVRWARGDVAGIRALADTVSRPEASKRMHDLGRASLFTLALSDGRMAEAKRLDDGSEFTRAPGRPDRGLYHPYLELAVRGPTPSTAAELDAAIANIPFRELPMTDRPYLAAAEVLARVARGHRGVPARRCHHRQPALR